MSLPALEGSGPDTLDADLPTPRPTAFNIAVLGPIFFATSIGVQLMMAVWLRFGPILNPALPEMTDRGRLSSAPEHDLPIYMAGLGGTMLLILTTVWLWRRKFIAKNDLGARLEVGANDDEARACTSSARVSSALLTILAAGSLICFMILLNSRFPFIKGKNRAGAGRLPWCMMLMPAIGAIVCAIIDLSVGMSRAGLRRLACTMPANRGIANTSLRWAIDASFCALIFLCIYIPKSKWPALAGSFYQADKLHHWNFFAFGPALEFIHGKAFATDFYSQYGIGWPLTFALFCKRSAFTVAHMIGIEITYGCIYYVALYGLLRLLLRSTTWAATGVLLAMMLQLFSGIDVGAMMWNFPSSTVLRHPADVWFFIALLLNQRTGKSLWIAVAGALAGAGIIFELDTGVYLPAIFALYLGLRFVSSKCGSSNDINRIKFSPLLAQTSLFAAPCLMIVILGLAIGSRGTFIHAAFYKGWFEGLELQAFFGLGLIPVAAVDDTGTLLFICMISTYLLTLGWGIAVHLWGQADEEETLLACISAYGLAVLLLFVARSHPYNLYHAAIPFVVVIVVLLSRLHRLALRYLARTSIPWVLCLALAITFWGKPQFLSYPSLGKSLFKKSTAAGFALRSNPSDIAILPQSYKHQSQTLRAVAVFMHREAAAGKKILVLDDEDTVLYYLSGVTPWSRYASLLHSVLTRKMLDDTQAEILSRRPDLVFIRDQTPKKWPFDDVWQVYQQFLGIHYTLQRHIGMYEVWQLGAPKAEKTAASAYPAVLPAPINGIADPM